MQQPPIDGSREAWLVYADKLQEEGDVRGPLIVLNDQVEHGADPAARDAYLAKHRAELFGDLALEQVEVRWRYGVPVCVSLCVSDGDPAAELAMRLLAAPVTRWATRLRLVGLTPRGRGVSLSSAVRILSDGLPRTCPALELVDDRAERARVLVSSDYDPGQNLIDFGPLATPASAAGLRELRVVVADAQQLDLSDIDAPALERFSLACLRWAWSWDDRSQLGAALAAARWPRLRHLALRIPETFTYSWPDARGAYHPGGRYEDESPYEDYGDEEGWADPFDWSRELGTLLQALHGVPLESLSLTSFASGEQLLQAFVDHGLPPTLRVLDLSDSDLSDEHLPTLVRRNDVFGHLDVIDLRGTFVTDASPLIGLKAEIRVAPGVGHRYQFSVGME